MRVSLFLINLWSFAFIQGIGYFILYFIKNLRDNCPCATCNDRRNDTSSLKIIDLQQQKSTITGWEIVGRYAVKFNWSDNHDTGIYTYEFLRKLCQCDECAKEK